MCDAAIRSARDERLPRRSKNRVGPARVLRAGRVQPVADQHIRRIAGRSRDRGDIDERDAAIADAKIVLNMHFYEDSLHEIGRTSYLLANSKPDVSECGANTEIEDDIREAMVAVPYQNIVESCVALINDEPRRQALEKKAFEIFSKRNQAEMLHDAIVATTFPRIA